MKKLLCAALLVPAVAFAADKPATSEGFYGRVDLGMDIRKDNRLLGEKIKDNKTPVAGLGTGYQFNEYFGSDLNLQYRKLKTGFKDTAGVKLNNRAITLMLNGTAQLPTGTIFTPYATAGMGVSSISKGEWNSVEQNTKSSRGFAWNTGFGVKTKVQDNVSLDLGYKFVNVGKIKVKADKNYTSKVQAHELTAGVIVSF